MAANKTCAAPWSALSLRNNNRVSICANSGFNLEVTEPTKLSQLLSHDAFESYRQSHQSDNLVATCNVCDVRAKHGLRTLRDNHNDLVLSNSICSAPRIQPGEILHLDVNLSNVCNLKCRMCSFSRSSTWKMDQAELARSLDFIMPPEEFQKNLLEIDVESFPNLKVVVLKGGEPFFDKTSLLFLKKLVELGFAKNISLTVFTNGVYVQNNIELLKKFKIVNLFFSFEGTGRLYQYIRGGHHSFDEFQKNIRLTAQIPNIFTRFMFTPQAYNLFNISEAVEFVWNEINPLLLYPVTEVNLASQFGNILIEPDFLAISVLPGEIRSQALQKIKKSSVSHLNFWTNFESVLSQSSNSENLSKFLKYSKKLDEIRKENIFEAIPELDTLEIRKQYEQG